MSSSDKVSDHYKDPKNIGKLDSSKNTVGTGLAGPKPKCEGESLDTLGWQSDIMSLQIEIDEKTKKIEDAKFKTFGTGSSIASSSFTTEWLKGKSIEEALKFDKMKMVEELALSANEFYCSVLAENAIMAAINDYQIKNGLEPIEA